MLQPFVMIGPYGSPEWPSLKGGVHSALSRGTSRAQIRLKDPSNHRVETNITIGGLSPFPGKETLPHTEFPLYCRTLPGVPSGASPLKMEKECFKPNPKATPMHEQYQPVGFSQKTNTI